MERFVGVVTVWGQRVATSCLLGAIGWGVGECAMGGWVMGEQVCQHWSG